MDKHGEEYKNVIKTFQNYIYEFRYKRNVLAEPLNSRESATPRSNLQLNASNEHYVLHVLAAEGKLVETLSVSPIQTMSHRSILS